MFITESRIVWERTPFWGSWGRLSWALIRDPSWTPVSRGW